MRLWTEYQKEINRLDHLRFELYRDRYASIRDHKIRCGVDDGFSETMRTLEHRIYELWYNLRAALVYGDYYGEEKVIRSSQKRVRN